MGKMTFRQKGVENRVVLNNLIELQRGVILFISSVWLLLCFPLILTTSLVFETRGSILQWTSRTSTYICYPV